TTESVVKCPSERVKGVVRSSVLSSPAERAGWRTKGSMAVANCGPPWDEKPKRPAYTGRRREAFGSPPLYGHKRWPCRAVEHTTLEPSDICGAGGEAPSAPGSHVFAVCWQAMLGAERSATSQCRQIGLTRGQQRQSLLDFQFPRCGVGGELLTNPSPQGLKRRRSGRVDGHHHRGHS